MKVIFTAFNGKLKSEMIELPDNTTFEFKLPMDMDVLSFNDKTSAYDTTSFKRRIGFFRQTGKSFLVDTTDRNGKRTSETAYEYVLTDVDCSN